MDTTQSRRDSGKTLDLNLIAEMARGNRDALAEIYDRHVRTVFRYALAQGLPLADAQDVTQDVFLLAFTKAGRIRIAGTSAVPWLLVTCKNLCYATLRRTRRELANTDLPEQITARDHVEKTARLTELHEAVTAAVADLTPIDQQIFRICVEGDSTYDEAAAMLGVTHATVRNRLTRLKKKLRPSLESYR